MRAATATVSSLALQTSGETVMNSAIAVEEERPRARTETTISRSVMMPTIAPTPGISTGSAPTSVSSISRAADCAVSIGETVTIWADMTSLTCIGPAPFKAAR